MSIAISARGVSKRYMIGHEQREPYATLRDLLAAGARDLLRRAHGAVLEKGHPETPSQEEFWALRDVDLDVNKGERVAIIGRNGAGKSTLLKILSRITEPTTGEIRIRGRVASLLEVGTGFHPELTGRENIFLNAAVLGMAAREIRQRFEEIVAFAEVDRFLDTPVKRYSSGMYMRLAFAVAAHLEPEILIIDEVLSVGDAQFQKKCLGRIEQAGKEGRTVLFVTHNLPTVLRLCPRSLLLDGGRVVANGESAGVIQTYLETRTLVGGHDLSDAPRMGGMGEQFRFTGCTVLDAQGQETNRLLFGEPVTIRLDTRASGVIDEVSLAVGFDTYAEVRAATLLSEESGVLYDYDAGQVRTVSARPQHFVLKPGKYFVTLGARRQRQPLDHLLQVLSFEVDSVPWKGTRPATETWGILHVLADWAASDA